MSDLSSQLEKLSTATKGVLNANHFDRGRFLRLAERLRRGEPVDNHVRGALRPPSPGAIVDFPPENSERHREYRALGADALRKGQCAFVLLAGGMATRMGGVVKALVEALPGQTFLDLRLREMGALHREFGKQPPLWLMTSYATDENIRAALGPRQDDHTVAVFPQHVSLRLTPQGGLFLDESGEPSLHAHGHGDFLDAVRQSGLLDRFLAEGGKTVMVANLDNLGASLDPAVVGFHLAHGAPCTSELVEKVGSDRGGIPVELDGKLVVLEEFRLPSHFDPRSVGVFNVNTFCFDAPALAQLQMDWTYFIVEKKVGDQPVIQFERLINELTFSLETRYLKVPREGAASRFLPVKDLPELAARQGEIRDVLVARSVLGG
ncbi:MAG TPA: UTP--glucose-1-phosphate uridylyltransferase [Polyangiaceae bacterium]